MSRLMLTPNYCSCTVNQARNLPDKGKNGGPDAFCTIGMGKEKFATAVRERSTAPDWHEQCDMPVVDDATIKLTVYHSNKSSLSKGDFIGRAYVPLRDLQDYDRIHTNWYPLTNRDGRVDKDRGEINVTLQFYSKNNTTGSVLDLATKKKHLSLKDIKHSLGDKLKTASKHRKTDKYTGENQLADQRRRLGGGDDGNGRDFLEDSISDTTSFSGSHMSLNSMSFNNNTTEQPRKPDNKPSSIYNQTPVTQKKNAVLPDIVIEQTGKSPAPLPPSKKPTSTGLSVLGYPNVKSVSVNPKVRQELDYLDREELLHVIAYQNDLIKKRDSRVKDLEQYTDGLLVKIVEQCPSILQNGNMKVNYK